MAALYPNLAINYGHQIFSGGSYNPQQTAKDIQRFKTAGITTVRMCYTVYNNANVPIVKACAEQIKQAGFYTIIGFTAGNNTTLTKWNEWKAALPALATWAQSVGIDEFHFSNEQEQFMDGTTITVANMINDVANVLPTTIRPFFSGKFGYCTDQAHVPDWVSNGIGLLDLIWFNIYDTDKNFKGFIDTLVTAFGNKVNISETNYGGGYVLLNNEYDWLKTMQLRYEYMAAKGIQTACMFAARARPPAAGGVNENAYAMYLTSGQERWGWNWLTNQRSAYNQNGQLVATARTPVA